MACKFEGPEAHSVVMLPGLTYLPNVLARLESIVAQKN
jgi:hypothetical protein